jgi:hypothetical protein
LKIADDFFAAFGRGLEPAPIEGAPGQAAGEGALEKIESSAVLHDPRTWNWIGWAAFLVVVVALAFLLLR